MVVLLCTKITGLMAMDNQKVEGYSMVEVARKRALSSVLGQCGDKWNYFFDGDGVVEKKICTRWRS